MKKILSFVSGLIFLTPVVGAVSACANTNTKSDSEIDVWNLSTWTSTQKKEINKKFMSIPSFETWQEYDNQLSSDLDTSFAIINPDIQFYPNSYHNQNVNWFIKPTPSGNEIVTDVFEKGLKLSVRGVKDGFSGSIVINLKGDKEV